MGDRETAPRFHVLREAAVATVEGDTDKERNDEDGEREMRKRERERERERDATFEHVAKEKHRADNRLIGRIKLGNGKENKLGKQKKKTALHRFCKRRTSLKRERERERERETTKTGEIDGHFCGRPTKKTAKTATENETKEKKTNNKISKKKEKKGKKKIR